jgi:4-amino-4-deoxy-L-arabinose transferase-like glycosyltransferase
MTESSQTNTGWRWTWTRASIALILAITTARIIALATAGLPLYADEAQYWVWSREFDWGYFSKPPMIAWLISLSTSVFGDTDFAIRLPAPLLHGATASLLALSARHIWNDRAGFYAALAYSTMPAIWLSGGIMSTDALLLCAWSGGLLALLHLREGKGWKSAAALGLAIGLGFLSKYAMIYFVVGLGLAVLVDAPARQALLSTRGALAAGIAAACIAPNILWNADHDFATVTHTAANANWGGDLFHPGEMAEFITAQFGVFGPVFFAILLVTAYVTIRQWAKAPAIDRLLILFVLPPILVVSAQAFISRAHANWAAAAYAAGTLLILAFLLRGPSWRRHALHGSVAFHVTMGLVMGALVTSPSLVETVGLSNATKRIRAWPETASLITEAGLANNYSAIVFDDRNVFHQMQRYATGLDRPLRMWIRFSGPSNHAEQVWPLEEGHEDWVLIISHRPMEVGRMREDFEEFEPVGTLSIPLDGLKTREFTLWRARGYQRITRDEAYEIRWREILELGD